LKAAVARKQARLSAGLTIPQLARKLGRKSSTIAIYERRGCNNAALAVAWSRLLECRLEIFL
jgi:transcriptional regulator with XRE-family HTH domain